MSEDRLMSISEAREFLGVSKGKMADLIKKGILPTEEDPLDRRVKLVRVSELEKLRKRNPLQAAA